MNNWLTDDLKTELKEILTEDYGLRLQNKEIEEFGENITKVFDLLSDAEMQQVQKFENRPVRFIDESNKRAIKLKERARR